MGDGCLMEGISHEAISLAGHFKLGNLIAFFDNNSISIDGATSLSVSDNQVERFRASGWHVQEIDGHDTDAIREAITAARAVTDKPSMIACRTIIGFGFPTKAGTQKAHSDAPGEEEIAGARKFLGWDSPPFVIPEPLLSHGAKSARRAARPARPGPNASRPRRRTCAPNSRAGTRANLPEGWKQAIAAARAEFIASGKDIATRSASGAVLDQLVRRPFPSCSEARADLTPSNNTKAKGMVEIKPGEYGGTYMHYGVREHGMAAAMNGIALHGGLIPYGGTFLMFLRLLPPVDPLAAMMRMRTIFVMTHDLIGLGEDGPTHQPVEQLAALRAIPHLAVYRPGDPVETAECWESIFDTPREAALIALSRQPMPLLRRERRAPKTIGQRRLCAAEAEGGPRKLTHYRHGLGTASGASGARALQKEGVPTAVVSLPCQFIFERQDAAYKRRCSGETGRVAVEAAVETGWDRYLGFEGRFVGMHDFGASGKSPMSTRNSTSPSKRSRAPDARRWRRSERSDAGATTRFAGGRSVGDAARVAAGKHEENHMLFLARTTCETRSRRSL